MLCSYAGCRGKSGDPDAPPLRELAQVMGCAELRFTLQHVALVTPPHLAPQRLCLMGERSGASLPTGSGWSGGISTLSLLHSSICSAMA